MLTATVTVDLDYPEPDGMWRDLDRDDRHALADLDGVPDGARLIVNVGRRDLVMPSARLALRAASVRLDVEIVAASPFTARKWLDAIRGDEAA